MPRLTVKEVAAAKMPPGKIEHEISDENNLVLRLRENKNKEISKSWKFVYRFNGKREKIHLGNYPLVGLAEARQLADDYRKLITKDIDPKHQLAAEKAAKLAEHLAATNGEQPTTVNQLFERWKTDYLSRKHEDKGEYVEAAFRRHVLPSAGELHLNTLRPSHVKSLLDTAYKQHDLTRTCGVILSNLRQMFAWACTFDWMPGDPTAGLKSSDWEGYGEERERTLSADEIKELYLKIPASTLGKRWELATWLVLATCTRTEETLLAERKHIDLEKNTWTIPVANQKKVRGKSTPTDHVVYLSPFAKTQIDGLLALPGTEKFVFPADARAGEDERPCNKKTHYHAVRNRQVGGQAMRGRAQDTSSLQLSGGPWTIHDLRRTGATMMGELGIDDNVIEKCLNHSVPDKVQRTYNRAKLVNPMKNAWLKLGEALEDITKEAENERCSNQDEDI